jgi:hypothetical protein
VRGELSTFVTVTIGKGGTPAKPSPTPKPTPIVNFGNE